MQVYKLAGSAAEKVATHQMSENVEFWRWVSANTIALVTASSVYHWNVEAGAPALLFQRLPNLAAHQIINYHVNHDLTWMCLVGIAQQNNRIVGHAQLFNTEKNVSQPIDACAVAFGTRAVAGQTKPATVFAFAARQTAGAGALFIIEVGVANGAKVNVPIYFPDNAPNDFPLAVELSGKYGVLYLLTKEGYFHLYDAESGKRIILNQVSAEALFIACAHTPSSGIMAVNKRGQVVTLTVNEQTLVPYAANTLQDVALAVSLAARANLPGAEALVQRQFQQLIQSGQHAAAAKVAAESPKALLRTPQTMALLKTLPASAQGSPLLAYFSVLLEKGKLNEAETLELTGPVIQQGRKDLLEGWLKDDKLHSSEALGDLVRALDPRLGLLVYDRAKAHHKVVAMLAETGAYDAMVAYAKRENYAPNWMQLLQAVMARSPQAAQALAKMLLTAEGGALMDANAAVDAFLARGLIKELTALLLDVLAGNKPQDAALQTRLLEVNLKHASRVADAILGNKMFSHYDRARVAQLCEEAGLITRALEHYDSLADLKRLLSSPTLALQADFLVPFCGRLSARDTLECLRELLKANLAQNLEAVVAVGVRYTPPPQPNADAEQLAPSDLVALFNEFHSYQGVYLYLKQVVPAYKASKELVFKFIEAAAKVGAVQDVEGACRAYEYEPVAVRELLKEVRLSDQLPLVIVCDKYGFVEDLTRYLYRNNMMQFIEAYVQNINPVNTPQVIGALLDENADEGKVKHLVSAVGHLCPVDRLVEEVERRNRLKLLRPWLEARYNEGNREPALHNALAKILIMTNDERKEQFLATNPLYDSAVVGKFCEQNEPDLAVLAYKRGGLFAELIEVTSKHGMFKQQARFLVEQQSPELWALVLRPDNAQRRPLIDQLVQTVLPETKKAELISVAVKAFIDAQLPQELIELLERLVLDSGNAELSRNRNLQNLLLLNAIKSAPDRVLGYVDKLQDYDAPSLAQMALDDALPEAAFAMYKKAKLNVEALTVLVDHVHDLQRATEFAERVQEAACWSKLGRALLQAQPPQAEGAMAAFLKADDAESYFQVIQAAKEAHLHEPLVRYLRMARKLKKEKIDTELALALAHAGKLGELEELMAGPHVAKLQDVGEQCFLEGLLDAARLCFAAGNNYARLAATLVRLGQLAPAVEAARKANALGVWKEVSVACLDAGEARLAQVCGLNIVVHGEELDELVQQYEGRGKSDELMALVENGLALERAHQGMFTVLAQLYSNYRPEKLMEHLKLFAARMNVAKVCATVKANAQWRELSFLYQQDKEADKAVRVMLEHGPDAWDDVVFKELALKVSNHDLLYDAIQFYLEQHAPLVLELLAVLRDKLDQARLVDRVRKLGHLPLIKRYLESVQEKNLQAVNDALHELYMDEHDYAALRRALDAYDNYDALALAQRLEKADQLELRRLAAHLYTRNKRYKQAVELSKRDELYQDAMAAAAASKDRDLAEDLLRFFVAQESAPSFAAALLVCYDVRLARSS